MRSGVADIHEINLIIRQKQSDILQEIVGKMLSEHKMLLYWTTVSGISLLGPVVIAAFPSGFISIQLLERSGVITKRSMTLISAGGNIP